MAEEGDQFAWKPLRKFWSLAMRVKEAERTGPFRDAEDLGDLGVRHPLDVEHRHHGAMIAKAFGSASLSRFATHRDWPRARACSGGEPR